jgi:YHS domain-containing protein
MKSYASLCSEEGGPGNGIGSATPATIKNVEGIAMAKDPICGMEVDERSATANLVYKGQVFYFCALSCYETFKEAPERYLVSRKSGWWTRFLNRLAKASEETYGNKPPTCH